ncbi:hypothetical protein GE09DRAFT_1094555 [Coniochaeta sp. 2T2.1]|nr:hypothetical protein GE09DRAFT_1094555 [Coniochaeta sp. 2T2.1]
MRGVAGVLLAICFKDGCGLTWLLWLLWLGAGIRYVDDLRTCNISEDHRYPRDSRNPAACVLVSDHTRQADCFEPHCRHWIRMVNFGPLKDQRPRAKRGTDLSTQSANVFLKESAVSSVSRIARYIC